MKFEQAQITKIIEQNYSHLVSDFFEMQTEYLASLNIIYHDLDASLVAMFLTSKLYKNKIDNFDNNKKVSLKYFYQSDNNGLPYSDFKIKEISSMLNLPRETVRRKKEKLIKDKLILVDKKKKYFYLNTSMVAENIIKIQINNLSKFLSKFSFFFSKNKFFVNEVSKEQIKKDVEEKFLLYLVKFLDFQIAYFSKMKTLIDIESSFIFLLCALNTTSKFKKNMTNPIDSKSVFKRLHSLNTTFGLNATSISEITKVPRTTVIRKIDFLEKNGMLKKDKFKRYTTDNLSKISQSNKAFGVLNHTIQILGLFFSECLETYTVKQ